MPINSIARYRLLILMKCRKLLEEDFQLFELYFYFYYSSFLQMLVSNVIVHLGRLAVRKFINICFVFLEYSNLAGGWHIIKIEDIMQVFVNFLETTLNQSRYKQEIAAG